MTEHHGSRASNKAKDISKTLREYLASFGLEDTWPLVEQMIKFDVPNDLVLEVAKAIAAARLKEAE